MISTLVRVFARLVLGPRNHHYYSYFLIDDIE